FVESPGASATITIDAINVAGDGVPYNGDTTDQDFALVCTNCILEPTFTLDVSPELQQACATAGSVDYTVDIGAVLGFGNDVTLGALVAPAGPSTSFGTNPVTPPGSSLLTVGDLGASSAGTYDIEVEGTAAATSPRSDTVQLALFTATPGAVTLTSPANGAVDVPLAPSFAWTAAPGGGTYTIEIADDAGFTNVVESASGLPSPAYTAMSPLAPETTYFWHVASANPCGSEPFTAAFSFTTRATPPILLVDDDDNTPNTRTLYEATLTAVVGVDGFDVWDTANSDDEPAAIDLAPYAIVIWFTGDEFGGACGPGAAGEAALASWLDDQNGCLILSSQDYHFDRGLTAFMQDYLGTSSIVDDNGNYSSVVGLAEPFDGLGPFTLDYAGAGLSDFSDTITPDGTATVVLDGNNGNNAALLEDSGAYRTFFLVFPFEAITPAAAREAMLSAALEYCVEGPALQFADGFESGDTSAWSSTVP
ncbi:MAG: hypothetical protein L0221_02600, partial [Chloroflexi bacterium]|nr:hypothetical protein [Chloroflexota bacterium]